MSGPKRLPNDPGWWNNGDMYRSMRDGFRNHDSGQYQWPEHRITIAKSSMHLMIWCAALTAIWHPWL